MIFSEKFNCCNIDVVKLIIGLFMLRSDFWANDLTASNKG